MADSPHNNNGEELETAPAVVLPIPDMPAAGLANQSVSSTSALVSPQPIIETTVGPGSSSLADTVEQELAADGRFAAFVSSLVIMVDDGVVHLSGSVPSLPQKQSLLNAVRAIPGVTTISDALTVA